MDREIIPGGKLTRELVEKLFSERKKIRLVIDVEKPIMEFVGVTDQLNVVFQDRNGHTCSIPMHAIKSVHPQKVYPKAIEAPPRPTQRGILKRIVSGLKPPRPLE